MMDDTENNITDSKLKQKTQKKDELFVQHVQNVDFGCDIFLPEENSMMHFSISARAEA